MQSPVVFKLNNMDIYAQNIIDHYQCPRHRGAMADADLSHHQLNTSCGDEIMVYVKLDGDKITAISFDGQGCAIATATISILTDALIGKSRSEVLVMGLEELQPLLGIDISLRRQKCALIGLQAIQGALSDKKCQDIKI